MSRPWCGLSVVLGVLCLAHTAFGFCGFYVAKADTKLFNKASQVAMVRNDDKTVLTMANDYSGAPHEFAMVVPVPTFLERDQIHVGDKAVLDHLDAYSAPRLVEYFDGNPCAPRPVPASPPMAAASRAEADADRAKSLGVMVEARYTVGEYDIVILSAEQSTGLETWLRENGYRIPPGAAPVLGSYINQGTRFFVAKVNLKEQARLGYAYLRPLQIAFESPKFMLPIRLGMVNADGPQDRAIQFSVCSPFRKGGWGDFTTSLLGKSPLAPLCKGGNSTTDRKLNGPAHRSCLSICSPVKAGWKLPITAL